MWNFIVPAVMGGLNYANQKAANKAKEAQNMAEAEKTRYSAWSGLGAGSIDNAYASPFMSGVGGALQGVSMNQAAGKAGGWGALLGGGQKEDPNNPFAMNFQQNPNQKIS